MGTSKSNSGPKNGSGLLPSWAPPAGSGGGDGSDGNDSNGNLNSQSLGNSPNNSPPNNATKTTTGNWGAAKASMGRFANKPKRGGTKRVGRSYVATFGGASNAAQAARAGVSAALALGSAFSQFSSQGTAATLNKYGLQDCVGQDADYALQRLIDKISPSGGTSEEAIAREAMVNTISNIYESLGLKDQTIDQLDNLKESDLKSIISDYIKEYIFAKCCYEIGIAIENKNLTVAEIVEREDEMKRFISTAVDSDFNDQELLGIDFSSTEAKELIETIVEQAYVIIGK